MRKLTAALVFAMGLSLLAGVSARADSFGSSRMSRSRGSIVRPGVFAGSPTANTINIPSAANTCPAFGVADNCNVFLTVNPNSTVTIGFTDPLSGNPASTLLYDCTTYHCHNGNMGDDWAVGVYNGSSQTIMGLYLTGNQIFQVFEGDGICSTDPDTGAYYFGSASLCSAYPWQGGFNGPNTVFYIPNYPDPNANGFVFFGTWDPAGTVFTNSGLAPGHSAYFSLTGPLETAEIPTPIPEPATLTLFATGLLGLGGWARRRHAGN
jgi:hypothetical protein